MSTITRVSRKELTADEIVERLDSGGRVIIEVSILGKTIELVVREQGGTYYCDTPMKLLIHESREELRDCLEQFRLVRAETAEERAARGVTA